MASKYQFITAIYAEQYSVISRYISTFPLQQTVEWSKEISTGQILQGKY